MDRIVLGSGKVYSVVATKNASGGYDIPAHTTLEVEANRVGYISGGATLEYTNESYTAKDDLGYVSKTILTAEDVVFKSGILTFDGNVMAKLSATGRVTEDATTHTRTVKIGGLGNDNHKVYIIRFVHESDEGKIRITIVGKNSAGFELQFMKDSESVLNAEFKAEALDETGTLVIYEEEDASIQ